MIIRTTAEYQMKLKQKRQIALTNFVNLIYTLDDCFQNNVEHILIKEAIDLEDENDPHISTVEHIYNSIYNVYYGFAITYNHLTKMLDAAIKFNEEYKLEYSQEFQDTLKTRMEAMTAKSFFGRTYTNPILDATNENLRAAIVTLDAYLGFASMFTKNARTLIDKSLFDYKILTYDKLFIEVDFIEKTLDMTRFAKLEKHAEKFNAVRTELFRDDEDDFDFTFMIKDHYPSEHRLNVINKTEIDKRIENQISGFRRQEDYSKASQQRELLEMFKYIENYHIRRDLDLERLNEEIRPAFFDLDRRGDIQYEEIIYKLTQFINEVAEPSSYSYHTKISGQQMLDIQTFSHFIIRVSELDI